MTGMQRVMPKGKDERVMPPGKERGGSSSDGAPGVVHQDTRLAEQHTPHPAAFMMAAT